MNVDVQPIDAHLERMATREKNETSELMKEWALSPATALGSSVRAKGILLEVRARLPLTVRKSLDVEGAKLTLAMSESERAGFRSASAMITETLRDIESLPVIPREIQDILTITTTERHRWLKDGRLPSAGTRTVRLAGRAKQITFHVFEPRFVEDLLDRGVVDEWREEDVISASEKRQQAIWKRKLTRASKLGKSSLQPRKTMTMRPAHSFAVGKSSGEMGSCVSPRCCAPLTLAHIISNHGLSIYCLLNFGCRAISTAPY